MYVHYISVNQIETNSRQFQSTYIKLNFFRLFLESNYFLSSKEGLFLFCNEKENSSFLTFILLASIFIVRTKKSKKAKKQKKDVFSFLSGYLLAGFSVCQTPKTLKGLEV